eukprot:951922-Prymnesium_polylepis.1
MELCKTRSSPTEIAWTQGPSPLLEATNAGRILGATANSDGAPTMSPLFAGSLWATSARPRDAQPHTWRRRTRPPQSHIAHGPAAQACTARVRRVVVEGG